jgi:hypothetical protein
MPSAIFRSSRVFTLSVTALGILAGCSPDVPTMSRSITRAPFGATDDGEPVEVFTMTNASGLEVRAITYGGTIISLKTPDRNGELGDIVLGFDALGPYLDGTPYFGAVIGRYGNRIGGGTFTLDGETFALAQNDGENHLHGGVRGFDKVVWAGQPFQSDTAVGVVLTYTSSDGEEGYPGTLSTEVTYTLTDADELVVDYPHDRGQRVHPRGLGADPDRRHRDRGRDPLRLPRFDGHRGPHRLGSPADRQRTGLRPQLRAGPDG